MRILLCGILLFGLVGAGCAGRASKAARHVDMQEVDRPPATTTNVEAEAALAPPTVKSPKLDSRPRGSRSESVAVSPSKLLTGKVLRVDKAAQFVVLVFPIGQMPAQEQRMSVYREGLKVGEVKISGPQRDDKTVGDIVAGEAEVGDQVSER